MHRTREPFWWSLFAAGGAVAALLAPVQIALTGILAARGWSGQSLTYDRALALVSHPLGRRYLLAFISLPQFHWAHRLRFKLVDLGLRRGRGLLAADCYGAGIGVDTLASLLVIRP